MRLFEERHRSGEGPAAYAERRFDYLDRSARPEAAAIRSFLEECFQLYPKQHQREIRTRLRGDEHEAAFFELLIHTLARRLGCAVTIHPDVAGTRNRPDLLVSDSAGDAYIEATLVTEESDRERGLRRCEEIVLDAINRTKTAPWVVAIRRIGGSSSQAPSCRRIASQLAKWHRELDPATQGRPAQLHSMPTLTIQDNGWTFELQAFLGRAEQTIGVISYPAMWGRKSVDAMRKKIGQKASRYGELSQPFIIAVNAISPCVALEEILEALYGTSRHENGSTASHRSMGSTVDGIRDSAFRSHTRISGALVCWHLTPWSLREARILLCHNPWARVPYAGILTQFDQVVSSDGTLQDVRGTSLLQGLDLAPSWPAVP